MNLPGTARFHVWLGLTVALAGVVVGGYAYTGDRIYHVENIAVAFLGFLLLVAGSILAGVGQANRPRLGGNPRNREEKESLLERVKASLQRDAGDGDGDVVSTTLACPDCAEVFDAEGIPPFRAECPHCGHEDRVEVPRAPGQEA